MMNHILKKIMESTYFLYYFLMT